MKIESNCERYRVVADVCLPIWCPISLVLSRRSLYSIEELALIDKLEAALRKEDIDEPELMDTGSPSGLTH